MKHPYLAKLALPLLCAGVSVSSAHAQGIGTVSGRVLDEKGDGLPGVTVLIEGSSLGGSTNSDGSYSIQNVPSGPHTLIMSFVGFTTQRQTINVTAGQNTTVAALTMSENTTLLNEAVVIGYGTQRKQDLTGAVEQISEKQFVKGQVTNPEQLIQGKVAGLQVTTGGGAPGSGSTIRIRGGSSLSASNDPLIIIDGVPVDNNGIAGASNALTLLNPADIASVTVLKDASATAIYGSRASNGVIIYTTKKGLQGEKLSVNVSSQNSVAQVYNYVDVLNADQFRSLVNARGNAQQKALLGTASTDWQREIYRTAQSTDNSVSLTGSAGKVPFRLSGGYLDQEGLLKNNDLKRYTSSLSLTPVLLNGNLRVELNVKGSIIDNNFSNQDAVGAALYFDPTQPIYASEPRFSQFGGYYQALNADGTLNSLATRNPVALLNQRRNRSTVKRSVGNIQLDYKLPFLSGLSANVNLGYDVQRGRGTDFTPANAATQFFRGGQNNQYAQDNDNKLLETFLKYDKTVGPGRLELLGGYSFQEFRSKYYIFDDNKADGTVFTPASYPYNGANFTDPQYDLLSYFGRLNYSIQDKYLLGASFRADQSSRFSPDNRTGYFPSASVAWRLKGEDFLQNSTTVSDLKLRLSVGQTGQQDLRAGSQSEQYYGYQALYTPSDLTAQYQFGNQFFRTLRPSFYNLNRKWETTTTYNAGLDYGFFDGRLNGSVDVYKRDTKDLLNFTPVPALANLSNAGNFNVGSLTNKGVEAILNVDVIRGERLNWTLNTNATFNRNEITKLTNQAGEDYVGDPTGDAISGGVGNQIQINAVGQPATSFYVYQQVYGADGKPLEGVYVDRNGDGIINGSDRYIYKSPRPNAILGLSSNLSYDKINFAFTLRSSIDNYVYNNVRSQALFNQNSNGFLSNGSTEIIESNFSTAQYQSDYFIENGSFLRMENVTLGYNFGDIYQNKANLRLSFAVQNLFLITKYQGLDPEVFNGIDKTIYPRPRTFTVGLNIGF